MSDKIYENFDLRFSREGNDAYKINVCSPRGEATRRIAAPFARQELEDFLIKAGSLPQDERVALDAAKKFGHHLFEQVFKDQIYGRLCANIDRCISEGTLLRIVLHLTETPELADLPWEYLYDQSLDRFLAHSESTAVVRYLEMPEGVGPLRIKLPLRILVMISNPHGYPQLDTEREWLNINDALANLRREGLVKLQRVAATEDALLDALENDDFQVFHFIGHGGFDEGEREGFLLMEDEEGQASPLSGKGIGRNLHDHRSLRLVVLNSCEGARASLTNPFAGTAQAIVQEGIPAVIAMQFEITDDAAITFSQRFYKAMASYYPVDAAVAEARKAIFNKKNYLEWATPALHMRSRDGRIFYERKSPADAEQSPVGPLEGYYTQMIRKITGGSVVFFLGPSVNRCGRAPNEKWSKGGCPPDDMEIAEHLALNLKTSQGNSNDRGLIHSPNGIGELVRVSQNLATLISAQLLTSELRSVLAGGFEPTPLHDFLATLPALLREKGYDPPPYQLIVTSNYDDVLEQAFKERGEPFEVVYYKSEARGHGRFYHQLPDGKAEKIRLSREESDMSWDHGTVILRIHGAFDPYDSDQDNYVITEDHYIDYLTRSDISKLLPWRLSKRLQDSHFLFLGYRLRDWNLRVIFHRLWGDQALRGDSWVIQPDRDPVDQKFWSKRNAHLLDVELADYITQMKMRLEALPHV